MQTGSLMPLPNVVQSNNLKHPFRKIVINGGGHLASILDFGHVYLARNIKALNGSIEIIYSAPLFVRFKTAIYGEVEYYGFDISETVDLRKKLKKHGANAIAWLPEVELNE